MKTNIPGRVTPAVEIHKSIKQGCPLAPLLFTVVMDELHRQCSAIGGYPLHTPHRPSDSGPAETNPSTQVASRGYCDDTAILADTWSKLGKLHHCVSNFFTKHGFKLNLTKTYLVGRHADGSALSTPLYWPGATAPIIPHGPDFNVRYLGLELSMDLDWTRQLATMTGAVMGLVSHIRHKRITLLQTALMIRYVMGKKLEIGFRHAHIPKQRLQQWDKWLKDAVATRTDLPLPKLHKSSILPILKTLDLERAYVL